MEFNEKMRLLHDEANNLLNTLGNHYSDGEMKLIFAIALDAVDKAKFLELLGRCGIKEIRDMKNLRQVHQDLDDKIKEKTGGK